MPAPIDPFSRRGFVLGVAAATVLVACGGSSDGDDATRDDETSPGDSGDTATIVQRFPQDVQEPGTLRLPISLATAEGALVQDGPAALSAQVVDATGAPLGERVSAVRRDVAPGPYYDFRVERTDPGVYALVVDGGPSEGAAFQVMPPGSVVVPGPGDPLEPFDTPTIDDPRGVANVCTREPEPCPFHDVTLAEALASGKRAVYLVGTPAFCRTGTCAPALESIIDLADEFGDRFVFVHAEVYADDTAVTPAPAVEALSLSYEPVLFVTGADGTIVDRLDAVWDATELREVLVRS